MPRIPRPAARIVIEVPGRTSRTMPATGVSSGSTMSPVATRQRVRHGNRYSPPCGPRPGLAPPAPTTRPIACQRSPGRGSTGSVDDLVLEARVAQALGDRGADHDRGAGLDDRTVARREGEDRVDRGLDEAPQRHELEVRRGPGFRRGTLGVAEGLARVPAVTHRVRQLRR